MATKSLVHLSLKPSRLVYLARLPFWTLSQKKTKNLQYSDIQISFFFLNGNTSWSVCIHPEWCIADLYQAPTRCRLFFLKDEFVALQLWFYWTAGVPESADVWASLLEWNLHRLECCQQSVLLTRSDSRHHVTPPSYSVSGSRSYVLESESEQPYLSPHCPQDSGRAAPLVDRRYWTKEGQQALKKATLLRMYRRDICTPDSFKFSVKSKMSAWFMNDSMDVV